MGLVQSRSDIILELNITVFIFQGWDAQELNVLDPFVRFSKLVSIENSEKI